MALASVGHLSSLAVDPRDGAPRQQPPPPLTDASSVSRVRQHDGVKLRPGLSLDDAFLAAFASAHGIRRLALYGSALRDDFGPGSDIDLLVEFRPEHMPGLLHLAQMELELEEALGRPVEFRMPEDLSPYFRNEVTTTARPLYAA
jgi:predicted nucleotidyltransferase